MADLLINGQDALTQWGVRMGKGFLDELGKSVPLKDYVTNSSRLTNGTQYAAITPRIAEQTLTLQFTIEGSSHSAFLTNKAAFFNVLYAGNVTIQVPDNSSEIFRLKYKNGTTYGQNIARTRCNFAAKFQEPDPTNRGLTDNTAQQ